MPDSDLNLLDASVVPEHAHDVKEEARAFADDHIAPVAGDYFDSGEYPWDVLAAGQEAGLVAADIPAEYGGRGLDLTEMLAMAEEFYRADAGIGLTLMLASFGTELLDTYGTEAQKEEYLPPVANGETLSGLAVSEPETGSDLAGMTTAAEKVEGGYEITGEKYWVGNGVEADWLTVYAKTGDSDDRYGNYSLFVVETDRDGYEAEHIPEKMGMRASKQAHIVFDDCFVPEENLIGAEGGGFYALADFFNHGRVVVGGHGIGLAAAAIEEAWEFVHGRNAFGRNVSEFQAVQGGPTRHRGHADGVRGGPLAQLARGREGGGGRRRWLLGRDGEAEVDGDGRRLRRTRDAAPRRAVDPHGEPDRPRLPRRADSGDLRGCQRDPTQPDLPAVLTEG